MADDRKFPAGSVIEFSSGEYSDYRTIALLVTIEDVDLEQEATKCRADQYANREPEDDYGGWRDPNELPSWLVKKQLALPVFHHGIHVGSYGDWELGEEPEENELSPSQHTEGQDNG